MPLWDKISHISFSTRDKEACADWFERVLAFRRLDEAQGEGWTAVLLLHTPSATIIEFQQHDANQGERFDPTRTGLDHLGFKVGRRDDLDDWQQHFVEHQVDFTPAVEREYGTVLTFRDPDGRQFEMFYRENHP